MYQAVHRPGPGVNRDQSHRHMSYPDIWTLLDIANHPVVTPAHPYPLDVIIEFDATRSGPHRPPALPRVVMNEVHTAMEASSDVERFTWQTPAVLAIEPNGKRSLRYPQLLVDMTSGVRVLIEIVQKGSLDDATIRNCGLISTVLPFRGMRYMVVFPSQFQRVLSGESE